METQKEAQKVIIKRLVRKDFINALRALKDNHILITFERDKPFVLLKDKEITISIRDKN